MSKTIHTAQDSKYCYHCGNSIMADRHTLAEKSFCCEGCKNVFGILQKNALCDYYSIDDQPGNQLGNPPISDEYEYLDEPSIVESIVDFNEGEWTTVRFHLPQMHCASCIWLLENLRKLAPGIHSSRVHFQKKEIHIRYSTAEITLRQVVELLATFGYRPVINLQSAEKENTKTSRAIYYKIGVVGFCFGNIMLTSFPEYVGLSSDISREFTGLFRWLNVLLALPVVFYGAADYWQSAISAVQTKIINLDVPIALGIAALFGRSLYEVISHTGSGYFDSLAGFVFFLLLGKVFQARTYSSLSFDKDFKAFFPLSINRISGSAEKPVKITELQIGDEIMVKNGQIVPVDAVLQSPKASIDYSFVTGESAPVSKDEGAFIYAGGRQVGGSIQLMVSKTVQESYLASLWQKDLENAHNSGLSRIANAVGKYFTIVVLAIAFAAFGVWWFIDAGKAFSVFTSVLIVACPCALALSIPFTYGTAMRFLAKMGFFLKDAHLIEKLANIQALVFDKTGTLVNHQSTEGQYFGAELTNSELSCILGTTAQSAHPLSLWLHEYLKMQYTDEVQEIRPEHFTEFTGKGVEGKVGQHLLRLGSAAWLSKETIAENTVHVEIDGVYKGYFAPVSALRSGIESGLQRLNTTHSTFMLSGDNAADRKRMGQLFNGEQKLYFNQQPHDKLAFIEQLKTQHIPVAMIGDGLNDAGALKAADFGISITDNTNNFTPAASAIMLGDALPKLAQVLQMAKQSRQVVYWAFAISFAYNLLGLSFAIQGQLNPVHSAILMPLSSISIVVFTTLTTFLKAKNLKIV